MPTQAPIAAVIRAREHPDLEHRIPATLAFAKSTIRWSNAVVNRRRWRMLDDELRRHSHELRGELEQSMLLTDEVFQKLATSSMLSVEINDPDSRAGQRARDMPWEYVLSAVTKPARLERRLSVVRNLGMDRPEARSVEKFLYVELAPGRVVRKRFNFDEERFLVRSHVTSVPGVNIDFQELVDPTATKLRGSIEEFKPDVIHVTGVNAFEVASMLGQPALDNDGVYLSAPHAPEITPFTGLVETLTGAGERPPLLIYFNLPRALRVPVVHSILHGAQSVIAIHGEFDLAHAEQFHSRFYHAWATNGFSGLLGAFDGAYREVKDSRGALRGSSIILASQHELVHDPDWPCAAEGPSNSSPGPASKSERPALESDEDARSLVHHDVKPITKINYSILHNRAAGRGQLFDKFKLLNTSTVALVGVRVEVDLHVGADRFPFRQAFNLEPRIPRDLAGDIRVPLTSELARGGRESLRTSLYVRIAYRGFEILEHTYPVTLLPVNEWQDDEENGAWLPSFILPRDPIVPPVIGRSLKYLKALNDDPIAGFDGYPAISGREPDPEQVDRQVQAIWSALLHDYRLENVTPPPSYGARSQRLRTPSQVVANSSGTCIDLVLLLAACLEFIDLYPIVLLMRDHALVGYWRQHGRYKAFLDALYAVNDSTPAAFGGDDAAAEEVDPAPAVTDERTRTGASGGWRSDVAWMVTDHREVARLVDRKDVYFVETTHLTRHIGYRDAVAEGNDRARRVDEFDCMIDLQLARRLDVTPLPLFTEDV